MRRVEPRRAATTRRERGPSGALGDEGVLVHDGQVVELEARAGQGVVDGVGIERPVGEQQGARGRDDDVLRGRPGAAGGRGAGQQRAVEVRRRRRAAPA